MSLYQKEDETREERLGILEEEKQKLEERLSQLQTALNRLNLKIKLYKEGKF
ncbi:MerR family transcriptional regulator [Streptococcus pneumoniae]|nr:MerR family transcriptional regulator [Streptococcus pneumoniae]